MGRKVKISKRVKRGWTPFDRLPGGGASVSDASASTFSHLSHLQSQGHVALEPNAVRIASLYIHIQHKGGSSLSG